jgi:hypothetical protein
MKNSKNKTKTMISLVLMLTVAVTIVAVPLANAHDPAWEIQPYAYISVAPNPVGVGQQVLVIAWLDKPMPGAQVSNDIRFHDYKVTITKPNGDTDVLTWDVVWDTTSSAVTQYTPDEAGTYTFKFEYPGQTYTWTSPLLSPFGPPTPNPYTNDTYLASSAETELVVQEDPIQAWQDTPLPTEYWTRPISGLNRGWASLAGNWLSGTFQDVGSTKWFGYGEAPESAHVMWTREYWAGGIMDARFDDIGYYNGLSYEQYGLTPPIILNGKLYYNVQTPPREGWYCVDLYTGETEYFHNTTGPVGNTGGGIGVPGESLAFGQVLNFDSPNQHGGFPYLWSTKGPTPNTWMMFDAFTGKYMLSINNVPTWAASRPYSVYGKDGSITAYNIVNLGNSTHPDNYLQCWNTTDAIGVSTSMGAASWRPGLGVTCDGNNGYSLNVSAPAVAGTIATIREDQYVIGGTDGINNDDGITKGTVWALSLESGKEGTLLWNITFTPPSTAGDKDIDKDLLGVRQSWQNVYPEYDVFIYYVKQTRQHFCYSLADGSLLWTSDPESQWNYYTSGHYNAWVYDGKYFTAGVGGELIAYDITTGDIVWKYESKSVGFESYYGNVPLLYGCSADGKIYMYTGEHSPSMPLRRDGYIQCINATDGALLWKLSNWPANSYGTDHLTIADGYLLSLNIYDNQIYCIGKGPSATTISASPKVSVHGSSILVEGMVVDTAAGTTQTEQAARFPNGVAAVSDESMSDWMEYVYMQQSKPTNATGVEVTISVLDPNGNCYNVGTTTTSDGFYKLSFTPEVPGEYTVYATFAGSESYYGSQATTAINVEEVTATPMPSPTPASMTDTYVTGFGIGAIIAIVVIGLVLILMLRKR